MKTCAAGIVPDRRGAASTALSASLISTSTTYYRSRWHPEHGSSMTGNMLYVDTSAVALVRQKLSIGVHIGEVVEAEDGGCAPPVLRENLIRRPAIDFLTFDGGPWDHDFMALSGPWDPQWHGSIPRLSIG